MSTVKTKIDADLVLSFLKENFDALITHIEFISGGESSQAFSFQTEKGSFVIRINGSKGSFEKDEYAFKHFASEIIPIPEIIRIGQLDEKYFFAISAKAEGKIIWELSEEEYQRIFPEFMAILDEIHKIDVSKYTGYGKWNLIGVAKSASWKENILSVNEYPVKGDLFETSFLEKDVWKKIYAEIEKLVPFCPEERWLVHGDYGHNNVISDGKRITGVLDWAESIYGDFVYDIAWLTFWNSKERAEQIRDYYSQRGIQNFTERLLCYELLIGLGSLSFYAYSQQEEKYDGTKIRIFDLLK